jgi:hypothetical protein
VKVSDERPNGRQNDSLGPVLQRCIWGGAVVWCLTLAFVGFVVRPYLAETYAFILRSYDNAPWITRWVGLAALGVTHDLNPAPQLAPLFSAGIAMVPLLIALLTWRRELNAARVRSVAIACVAFNTALVLWASLVSYALILPWGHT